VLGVEDKKKLGKTHHIQNQEKKGKNKKKGKKTETKKKTIMRSGSRTI